MRNPKFDLKQEEELKRKWRNPGWVGVVSSIVIGGGESPPHAFAASAAQAW